MKKLVCLLCVLQLLLCMSCARNDNSSSIGTTLPTSTSQQPTTVPTVPTKLPTVPTQLPTEPVPVDPIQYRESCDVFSEAVLEELAPAGLTDEERNLLYTELDALLEKKQYGETAENMIRYAVEEVICGQDGFQTLFGFLNPYDTYTYIRKYMLEPLESMVDEIRCCGSQCPEDLAWLRDNYGENPGFQGLADEHAKRVVVVMKSDLRDALVLVHELHHMAVLKEHSVTDNTFYLHLDEGGSTLHQLTFLYSYYLSSVGSYVQYMPDPNHEGYYLKIGGMGSQRYTKWSNSYFKLLALTDFEIMDLFLQPRGDRAIRQELIDRYGEEGGAFYDSLGTLRDFEDYLESESLFLKLFASRMEEIDSAADAASYAMLYRFYRNVFCYKYVISGETGTVSAEHTEAQHQRLPFAKQDRLVAEELLRWSCLNVDGLSQEDANAVAMLVASSYCLQGREDANILADALYQLKRLKNGDLKIYIWALGRSCEYRYAVGEECIYWEKDS